MSESSLRVVWIYPDLLSTYGDQGNALVVEQMRELAELKARVSTFEDTVRWGQRRSVRLALRMDGVVVKAAPPGTFRRTFLQKAISTFDRLTRRRPTA